MYSSPRDHARADAQFPFVRTWILSVPRTVHEPANPAGERRNTHSTDLSSGLSGSTCYVVHYELRRSNWMALRGPFLPFLPPCALGPRARRYVDRSSVIFRARNAVREEVVFLSILPVSALLLVGNQDFNWVSILNTRRRSCASPGSRLVVSLFLSHVRFQRAHRHVPIVSSGM